MTVDILWLNASPRMKGLDRPMLRMLAKQYHIAQWEYVASWDRGTSFEVAQLLLKDYLIQLPADASPVHLVGHGLSGVLALEVARLFPEKIKSLVLLGIGGQIDQTWHAYYHRQRQRLASDRQMLVKQMVYQLFERPLPYPVDCLKTLLAQDLELSPNLHSSGQCLSLPARQVSVPMLVCGSLTDSIVSPEALETWKPYLKTTDRFWLCPSGKHFFHFYHPEAVVEQLCEFWQSLVTDHCSTSRPEMFV
jgi:pimeloyl-ACP methyl ester carboxylesterase